ncbi:hypothetical protein [Erythrobacter rubeus]|uniref:DoxX family protein n=1 Tax=Erythrobacter rubeus TaxID=2760803 RepID=A0ABR8KSF4_9SPHN|nr:hypothetical protein [Erythrobacter rubeus]MBD2842270.1 hypothetical protein [Erythrobacter rubeus]
MTARLAQFGIAAVFLVLGAWALFFPASVIELALTEPYRENTFMTRFIIACFGSQAVLFGAMALFVRFTARAFLAFAVLLLPFFWFNWYFHYEMLVLTSIGMLDFAGNVTMFALAILGWRAAKREEAAA